MQNPTEKLDKLQTDDGEFRILPKEIKKHIFSFLRGSPIVSSVCKNFEKINEDFFHNPLPPLMKGQIYEINISDRIQHTQSYATWLFYEISLEKSDEFFNFLTNKFLKKEFILTEDIFRGHQSLAKLKEEVGIDSDDFYNRNTNPMLRPYILFCIKEDKLHEFLSCIDLIKSNDCKINNKPLGVRFDELVQEAEQKVQETCLVM